MPCRRIPYFHAKTPAKNLETVLVSFLHEKSLETSRIYENKPEIFSRIDSKHEGSNKFKRILPSRKWF